MVVFAVFTSPLFEDERASDKWALRLFSLFFNIKKAYVQVIPPPPPPRTVCTLVKMMIIMDDPLSS